MQSMKQILGWEEGRSRFLNICFSTLIVLALFTVALGLHIEFTATDGLRAETAHLTSRVDARLP